MKANSIIIPLYNVFVRALSALSRFLFSFALIKYYSLSLSGTFTLIFSAIETARIFFSYEFYLYSTKELVLSPHKTKKILFNQWAFHTTCFAVLAPVVLLVLTSFEIDFSLHLCILLYTNLMNMQMENINIAFSKSGTSNTSFFIRYSFWHYVLITLLITGVFRGTISINSLVLFWTLSEVFAGFFNIWNILKTVSAISKTSPQERVVLDLHWIQRGIKSSSRLFPSAMIITSLLYSIIFMIKYFLGARYVSIYSVFYNSFSITATFAMVGIINIELPSLLKKHADDKVQFESSFLKMCLKVIAFLTIALPTIYIALPYLLKALQKEELIENAYASKFFLASAFLYTVSFLPKYYLYITNRYKHMLLSYALSAAIVIPCSLIAIKLYKLNGVIFSSILTNSMLLITLTFFCLSKKKVMLHFTKLPFLSSTRP